MDEKLISVYTPAFSTKRIYRAYESLLNQTYKNWEWVLYLNGPAKNKKLKYIEDDSRVKIYRGDVTGGVGPVKFQSVLHCQGEWLVELDEDDELFPQCLQRISETDGDFAFSNWIEINEKTGEDNTYGSIHGWKYRDVTWKGEPRKEAIAPMIHPGNFGIVWRGPNHVRAVKREWYWKVGGYNRNMIITDDHDLNCRLYIAGAKFVHIDEPLYVYYMHGNNSIYRWNKEIQETQWKNYDKYIIPLYERWCREEKLGVLDLSTADFDLEKEWPLKESTVGIIKADEIIDKLSDPVAFMNNSWRVLAPNGMLLISVASAFGQGGYCNPNIKSRFVKRSFRYYTEPSFKIIIPEFKGMFLANLVRDTIKYDKVLFIDAHLIAFKEEPCVHGANYWLNN